MSDEVGSKHWDPCRCAICQAEGKRAGVKHDSDKPDWTLLPWPALEEVVRVLEHGARRYGRDNWRKVPEPERRYLAAAIRHITAVLGGELVDPDSKRAHLAHAVCSLLFLFAKEEGH